MSAAADQSEALRVSHRLAGLGAHRGAFQVLMGAAAQRQSADVRDAPKGDVIKPRKQFHAANDDHDRASKPAATIA